MKDNRWIQTKAVLEKVDNLGLEEKQLILAPFTLNLEQVESFRPSHDPYGNQEEYTNIYFKSGHWECINMNWKDFQKMIMEYEY